MTLRLPEALARHRAALRVGLPLLVVLLLGCAFHANGAFFTADTHRTVFRDASVYGILACGMTLVVIAGGIDLAVGSVLALGAVLVSVLLMPRGWSTPLAVLAVLTLGAVCGATVGSLVAFFRTPAFVMSLAMMAFARGLAKWLAGGKKVAKSFTDASGDMQTVPLPALFEQLDDRILGGYVSVVTLVFAVCATLTWVVLARTTLGRYLYAIGGNREAARLAGVPVNAALVIAFTLSGLFATLAGICQAAQEQQGDPDTGIGYELDAITMVVLGGVSLSGGRGSIGGTLVGVLTIGYLQKVLSLNAFSIEARLMLTGLILAFAVVLQQRAAPDTAAR